MASVFDACAVFDNAFAAGVCQLLQMPLASKDYPTCPFTPLSSDLRIRWRSSFNLGTVFPFSRICIVQFCAASSGSFATCIIQSRTRSQQVMILKRPSVWGQSNQSFALRRLRHKTNVDGLNSMRMIPAQCGLFTSSVYLSSYSLLPRQIDHSYGIGGGCGLGILGLLHVLPTT